MTLPRKQLRAAPAAPVGGRAGRARKRCGGGRAGSGSRSRSQSSASAAPGAPTMGTRDDEYDYLFKGNGRAAPRRPAAAAGSPSAGGAGLGGALGSGLRTARPSGGEAAARRRGRPPPRCPRPRRAGKGPGLTGGSWWPLPERGRLAELRGGWGTPAGPRCGPGAALPRAWPSPARVLAETGCRGGCLPHGLAPQCQSRAGFRSGAPACRALVRAPAPWAG